MATEAKILANRRNSQKSTGPRTPHGKAAVSQNAVSHGLSARQAVISSESRADFDLYRDQILAELVPATPMESILAERIVNLSWRLKRVNKIQNQTFDVINKPDKTSPLSRLTQSMLSKYGGLLPANHSDSSNILNLGRLAVKDFSNTRVLERLLIYERRIENSLYKTFLEFQRLKLIKQLNSEA